MEIELKNPDIRKVKDMMEVIIDKEWATNNAELDLYYMYRAVKQENGLRYDITVIPPLSMGEEYVKTKGHFHSSCHAEMYIVLKGEGLFLSQKGEDIIEDIYATKAKTGDVVMVPKGYAHITINASGEILEMANWVSPECVSEYKTIGEKNGACYFYTKKGWIKNNNYKSVPEIRFEETLKEVPEDLDFLK